MCKTKYKTPHWVGWIKYSYDFDFEVIGVFFCAEKYLKKGLKILVSGRIQTGSYVNQEGNKVYATNVIVEEHNFAEGKKLSGSEKKEDTDPDGFMHLSDGEELSFE